MSAGSEAAGPERRDRVLIVDDTPDTLDFLTEALEAEGMTALVATSGPAALRLVGQIAPDLILMDGVMPGMSGFETTRILKQTPGVEHVPVIFMTGLSETEHVLDGLSAGGVDYVTKPIVLAELLARIRVHLANARVAFGARSALDATGRNLLSIDREGRLLWCTPRTEALLAALFGKDGTGPEGGLSEALAQRLLGLAQEGRGSLRIEAGGRRIEFAWLNPLGPEEYLFRVTEEVPGAREAVLRAAFGLTMREAEILLWLAQGKANKDISEILGISPRTVNKHLEQVFDKLGVENRATAAALATRALAARG